MSPATGVSTAAADAATADLSTTDQSGSGDLRDGLGEFRLADPGGALHEERLAEAVGQEDGRGDRGRRQIAGLGEARGDVVDGCEQQQGLQLGADEVETRARPRLTI